MFGQIRSTGWKYSLAIAFNRVVPQFLFRCRRFVVFRLGSPSSQADDHHGIRWAESSGDWQAAEDLTAGDPSCAGDPVRVAIATADGNLVGGLWCCGEHFEESDLGITIRLNDNQRWLFSGYVDREYRQRGVYRELLSFVARQSLDKEILLAINPDNRRSMQAHHNAGLESRGRVVCLRILGMVFCRVQGDVTVNRGWTTNWRRRPVEISVRNQKGRR